MYNYVILIVFIIILSGNGHRQEMQKIARRTYKLSHTALHMIKNWTRLEFKSRYIKISCLIYGIVV